VIDGAHNLHAARRLVLTWREEYGDRRCTLIFGALADKDPAALIAELAPLASEVFLVRVDSPRTVDPGVLAATISAKKIAVHTVHTLSQAFGLVFGGQKIPAEPPQGPVLLAGSLFLVGEALSLIAGGHSTPRTQ
jgi:dihydrofolate synthase/folylpolyglutamate synthase